jgi:hypothetical protein
MIRAGRIDEICSESGKWVIIDIGFANNTRSSGLLLGQDFCGDLQFSEAVNRISDYVSVQTGPVNLLIEAPLSVAFDHNGNPKGRSIERQTDNTPRYWYLGVGCQVMVAALYLTKALLQANPNADIRLFEGFVSYREVRRQNRPHYSDALLLKEVVDHPDTYADAIFSGDSLKIDATDGLHSAFLVSGIDPGIPPIIKRAG